MTEGISEELINLQTLGDGAIAELFAIEFQKVLQNIGDPNTSARFKREVTIKLTVLPNEDREIATMDVAVTSRLAPAKVVNTTLAIAIRGSVVRATELRSRQISIFDAVSPSEVQ